MSAENSQQTSLKQKAVHEGKEITYVFLYLAAFFCALATYSMLLLEKFEISYFTYGAALLNALIITKIILIGEAVHFGKKHEAKPLFYSCAYKAFVYGVLVFAFHIVEEVDQAADPWKSYCWGVPRSAHRRPTRPQRDHFLNFHSLLCVQGVGAGYGTG